MKKALKIVATAFGGLVLLLVLIPTPDTPVVETTTTAAAPTTTTTEAPTGFTMEDAITMTKAESLTYADLTWVDTASPELMAMVGETICAVYATNGDKEETLLLAAEAFFSEYDNPVEADYELFFFFGGGVIDLICESPGATHA
jgi:hypothetical protein